MRSFTTVCFLSGLLIPFSSSSGLEPIAPTLVSPTNTAEPVPLSPVLNWNFIDSTVTYGVQVSTSSGFLSTVFSGTGLADTDTTQQVGPLSNLTIYYWRANAKNSGGTGPWSGVESFVTITPRVIDTTQFGWKRWHVYTITWNGPQDSESAVSPHNPFTDYRLIFTCHQLESGGEIYPIPGYFAADGNAGRTGATSGNKWRIHFMNQWPGTYSCKVSFRTGPNIAASDDPNAGTPVVGIDGDSIFIDDHTTGDGVNSTNSLPPDMRYYGKIAYHNSDAHHVLKAMGTGTSDSTPWFLFGVSSPSNFLADTQIVNTPSGPYVKSWQPHVQDWNPGDTTLDPTLSNSKGKGIIGALNYLSGQGVNALSFSTMDIGGSDTSIYPFVHSNDYTHFDCAKLDQWLVIFDHAEKKGIFLTLKALTGANQSLLDSTEWKVYFRELIARFGQYCGISWDVGDDNTLPFVQQQNMLHYFRTHDPFGFGAAGDRSVAIGCPQGTESTILSGFLGDTVRINSVPDALLNTVSLETDARNGHAPTLQWVRKSDSISTPGYSPWIVTCGTQIPKDSAVPPDSGYSGFTGATISENDIRKNILWGNLMANGGGVTYSFGNKLPQGDLTCQDFRSRQNMWAYNRYANRFFIYYLSYYLNAAGVNMFSMTNADSLIYNSADYCLATQYSGYDNQGNSVYYYGSPYVIYLPNGGTAILKLNQHSNDSGLSHLRVWWFNPRTGVTTGNGTLQRGDSILLGPSGSITAASLGPPPSSVNQDWVALITQDTLISPPNAVKRPVNKIAMATFTMQTLVVSRDGLVKLSVPGLKVGEEMHLIRADGRIVSTFAVTVTGRIEYRCAARGCYLLYCDDAGKRMVVARILFM